MISQPQCRPLRIPFTCSSKRQMADFVLCRQHHYHCHFHRHQLLPSKQCQLQHHKRIQLKVQHSIHINSFKCQAIKQFCWTNANGIAIHRWIINNYIRPPYTVSALLDGLLDMPVLLRSKDASQLLLFFNLSRLWLSYIFYILHGFVYNLCCYCLFWRVACLPIVHRILLSHFCCSTSNWARMQFSIFLIFTLSTMHGHSGTYRYWS